MITDSHIRHLWDIGVLVFIGLLIFLPFILAMAIDNDKRR